MENKWNIKIDSNDADNSSVKLNNKDFPYVRGLELKYDVDDLYPSLTLHIPPEMVDIEYDVEHTTLVVGDKRFIVLDVTGLDIDKEDEQNLADLAAPANESYLENIRTASDEFVGEVIKSLGIPAWLTLSPDSCQHAYELAATKRDETADRIYSSFEEALKLLKE